MAKSIKIFQIIDSLQIGGAEQMAINISNLLNSNGYQIEIIVGKKIGPLNEKLDKNIPVFYLNKRNFYDIKAFWVYYKKVKIEKPDFIHAHSSSIIWAILLKLAGLQFQLIWHDHFGKSLKKINIFRSLIILLSSQIDTIIVVNRSLFAWSSFWTKNERVYFINNFPKLEPQQSQKRNLRKILCLANFRPQKDHINLLKAFYILKNNTEIQFKFSLVGAIVDFDYFENVKNKIKDFGLESNCDFIGGLNNPERELYSASIGVLSSNSEGLPVSLLEYGIARLFPIVTDVGECRSVVGSFGNVVEKCNPEQLANAILDALNLGELELMSIGEKFGLRIDSNYGEENFLKEYRNVVS
jgi:glycosyltransferase involved in cell wall biosynthesis